MFFLVPKFDKYLGMSQIHSGAANSTCHVATFGYEKYILACYLGMVSHAAEARELFLGFHQVDIMLRINGDEISVKAYQHMQKR